MKVLCMVQQLQFNIIFISSTLESASFYCQPDYNKFRANSQTVKTRIDFLISFFSILFLFLPSLAYFGVQTIPWIAGFSAEIRTMHLAVLPCQTILFLSNLSGIKPSYVLIYMPLSAVINPIISTYSPIDSSSYTLQTWRWIQHIPPKYHMVSKPRKPQTEKSPKIRPPSLPSTSISSHYSLTNDPSIRHSMLRACGSVVKWTHFCWIWGSHTSDHQQYYLQGCYCT
jgi:hypothetical protein